MELVLLPRKFNRRVSVILMVAAGSTALAACNTSDAFNARETFVQGYVIDEEAVALAPVGSSRDQVLLSLGSPSTTATFDNEEVFYYISQTRTRGANFMQRKLVDQRVLAVYFGDNNRVANIANYGMQDGKLFDFVSRTTPVAQKDQNFLVQMISGIAGGATSVGPGLGRGN